MTPFVQTVINLIRQGHYAIPSPLRGGLGRGGSRKNNARNFVPHAQFSLRRIFPSIFSWFSCVTPPSLTLPSRGRERHRTLTTYISILAFTFLPTLAFAAEEADNTSHLPLPRFASLRSGEVNMRTGPGTRYPIAWVYTRRGLPVEVIAEYDIWRRVRDPAGAEGWVNKTELTGKREAVITGGKHDLRNNPDEKATAIAHLEADSIGQIVSCAPDWCKLKFDDVKGYLRKTDFWGAYPNEKFD